MFTASSAPFRALGTRPHQEAEALLTSLAASRRVVLLDGIRPALIGATGRLTPLPRDPESVANQLAYQQLIEIVDQRPSDRKACAQAIQDALRSDLAAAHLPTISRTVRLPCFRRDGDRLVPAVTGFADGVYYAPANLPLLPQVDPNFPLLHALFSGFMFSNRHHRANALGILCACFARPTLESFPVILVSAARKSSGKSTLAQAFHSLFSDTPYRPTIYTGDEKDMETRMASIAGLPGPNLFVVDNVRPKRRSTAAIRSQFLSAATSSHAIMARVLYQGSVPVCDPIFLFTMNGARVEQDLADKVVQLVLTLPDGVSDRAIDPYPPDLIAAHRLALLAEIHAVLDGLDAVTPLPAYHTRFYAFERVAVRAAARLGLEANFDRRLEESSDSLLIEVAGLLIRTPGQAVPAEEVVQRAEASQNLPELREFLYQVPLEDRAGRGTALCRHLSANYPALEVRTAHLNGRIVLDSTSGHGYTLTFQTP